MHATTKKNKVPPPKKSKPEVEALQQPPQASDEKAMHRATDDEFKGEVWKLVHNYFAHNHERQLVKHLIDSYNDFVLRKIDLILDSFNPIECQSTFLPDVSLFKYVITFKVSNPTLNRPLIFEKDGSTKIMTPHDARTRGFSYSSPLLVDINVNVQTYHEDSRSYMTESRAFYGVSLGKIPIMVRSRYCMLGQELNLELFDEECRYDLGGYFIVNGNEKVVISSDRIAENRMYTFVNSKVSAYSHMVDVRSVPEGHFGVPKITSIKISSKPNQLGRYLRASVQHIRIDVPVFVLFRALGIESDREIIAMCNCRPEELAGSVEDGNLVFSQRDALDYLSRFMSITTYPKELATKPEVRMSQLDSVIKKDLLPHVGNDPVKKARYLGGMVRRIIDCVSGKRAFDDRDSYINKRVDTPGVLVANLFRQHYAKVVKELKNGLHKEINTGTWKPTGKIINVVHKNNITKIVRSNIIEAGLRYGLSTGNWGIKTNKTKQGVAQVLNRMTASATLSHLRRINTSIEKSGKLVQPRKLHGTQWGIICPAETPEGASVGLVKNLSLMAVITLSYSSEQIRFYLADLLESNESGTRVVINGDLFCETSRPLEVYRRIKAYKLSGQINVYTGISWHVAEDYILISTEGGRCVRPLFVVPPGQHEKSSRKEARAKSSQWSQCVLDGTIEYLDVEEASLALIAMRPSDLMKDPNKRYTHIEIDPSLILGVLAGSIPFSDHNQSPRNTYQSAMGKQAIGTYSTRFRERYDTMSHVLNYPQRPLVYTQIGRITKIDKLPCGINVIVGISTYTGYNQEDSIIMNLSSVERGMFSSTFFRTYKEQNNKNHSTGEEEFFCNPDAGTTRSMKPHNYGKLNDDGFVPQNRFVDSGDIIIGKCMPQRTCGPAGNDASITNRDASVVLKGSERGFVDRNCYDGNYFTNINGDGYQFAKVRIRGDRQPTIGDKFCLPPDFEVMTTKGWKKICDIRCGGEDLVAQLDAEGSVSYVAPTAVYSFACDPGSQMVRLSGGSVDLLCTPEHKVPVFFASEADDGTSARLGAGPELVAAVNLVGSRHAFAVAKTAPLGFTGGGAKTGEEGGDEEDEDGARVQEQHDARVLLLFIAHRHSTLDRATMSVQIRLQHVPAMDSFYVLLDTLSLERELLPQEQAIRIHSAQLYLQLLELRGSTSYPDWLLLCRPELLRKLILEVIVPRNTWDELRELPRCFADSLQQLALHARGLCVDLSYENGNGGKRSAGVKVYDQDDDGDEDPTTRAELVAYEGRSVHCLEVPSHVFFVRAPNGMACWTGNSSRHGQKGTIGMLYRQEDMPFSSTGLQPDIIINPHAIPSRMTIAQLMECIMGKACTLLGTFGDATPFTDLCVEDLSKVLEEYGLERYGNEIMYNSRTGEQMQTTMFIGPTFYQRLKHMVDDKIHTRAANGPVVMLTRQPAEGRARDGGLRLGEMEIECNWAHGTMQFLKERFMECSDNYRVHVCKLCGKMAIANPDKNIYSCKPCKNTTSFSEIRIPYACKLFFQEIQAMNIGTRFLT